MKWYGPLVSSNNAVNSFRVSDEQLSAVMPPLNVKSESAWKCIHSCILWNKYLIVTPVFFLSHVTSRSGRVSGKIELLTDSLLKYRVTPRYNAWRQKVGRLCLSKKKWLCQLIHFTVQKLCIRSVYHWGTQERKVMAQCSLSLEPLKLEDDSPKESSSSDGWDTDLEGEGKTVL